MRKIVLILLAMAACKAHAQDAVTTPTNRTNVIIVKTELSYDDLYRNTGRLFVAHNLSVASSNKDFGTIESSVADFGNFPIMPYSFHALIDEGVVKLYGKYYSSGLTYHVGKANKKAWKLLTEIAESLGGEITYLEDLDLVKN